MFQSLMPNIMAENVKETVDFYTGKLSFEVVTSVPAKGDSLAFAILKKDNALISFQEQGSLAEEYPSLKTDEIKPTFTLFVTVDDVDSLHAELKEKVEIAAELHETFYHSKEFAIFDNNGNILTFSMVSNDWKVE